MPRRCLFRLRSRLRRLRSRVARHNRCLHRLRNVQGPALSKSSLAAVVFALTATWTLRLCSGFLSFWDGDDPDSERRQGLGRHWPHRHAPRDAKPGTCGPGEPEARSSCCDLYIFRGRRGDLVKILWHDGLGMSLYAKRLDRGKFIWPSASDGAISISAAQMAYILEGIDWRNPQLSWRPQSAG